MSAAALFVGLFDGVLVGTDESIDVRVQAFAVKRWRIEAEATL